MPRRMAAILGTIAVVASVLATPAAAGGIPCPLPRFGPGRQYHPPSTRRASAPTSPTSSSPSGRAGRWSTPAPRTASRRWTWSPPPPGPGGRRGADPGHGGPAVPGQRPGRADQRLLHPGPLRQRLVLRRGHRRAGPPRPRRQPPRQPPACWPTAPNSASSCGPPTTRPQVPPGVVRGPGRGRVQGGQPPLAVRVPYGSFRHALRTEETNALNQTCWTTSTTSRASARSRSCRSRDPGGAQAGRDHLLTWTWLARAPRPCAPAVRTAGAEFTPTGGWPGTDPVGGWS